MAIENFKNKIKMNDILAQPKENPALKDIMEKNDDDFIGSLPPNNNGEVKVNYYHKAEKAPNDILSEKTENNGFGDLF